MCSVQYKKLNVLTDRERMRYGSLEGGEKLIIIETSS